MPFLRMLRSLMVMPAFSFPEEINLALAVHPAILMPPSVTARAQPTLGLPGPPIASDLFRVRHPGQTSHGAHTHAHTSPDTGEEASRFAGARTLNDDAIRNAVTARAEP